jgi:tetratricopeptide (TPR) repeat protein
MVDLCDLFGPYSAASLGLAMGGGTSAQNNPCGTDTLLLRGQRALERRDWPEAAKVFAQLVQVEPGVVQGWLGLGIAALEQKRFRLAGQALEQARSLAPANPYVAANLAGLLRVQGRSADAVPLAQQASDQLPDEPLVQLNRWLLEQDLGGLEIAAEGYSALLRRWPQMAQVHYHLGHVRLVHGRLDEAAASLHEALDLQPGNDAAHQALVGLHLQRGEAELALQRLEARRLQRPYDGYDLALRCLALRNLGREAEAAPLDDTGAWLSVQRLEQAPEGWSSVSAFNAAILDYVRQHPDLGEHHGQATHNGRRIENLLENASGPIPPLAWWILGCLRGYLEALRQRPHPLGRLIDGALELRGWAVLMHEGGYETPHLHPSGLLSAVYYAAVPEVVQRNDDEAGNLCFGVPDPMFPLTQPLAAQSLTPQPGLLVIFPSWHWHHTVPFSSEQPRLSLAFDLFPQAPAP